MIYQKFMCLSVILATYSIADFWDILSSSFT